MHDIFAILTSLPPITWRVIMACIGSAVHALQDKKIDPTIGITAWLSGWVFGVVFTELMAFGLYKLNWLTFDEFTTIGWAITCVIGYSATDWLLAVRNINGQFKAAPIQFVMDLMAGFLTSALDFVNKNRKPKSE